MAKMKDIGSEGKLDKQQREAGGLLRVEATLTGHSPLMFNRLTEVVMHNIENRTTKSSKAEKLPREEHCQQCLHTVSGEPVVPSEMLLACLIDAGRFVKMGKSQVSTRKDTQLPALMSMESAYMPIFSKGGWEVDVRPGRAKDGSVVICVRPKFMDWQIKPRFLIDLDEVSERTIRELFDKAGMRIGLGEFRPAKKGFFGQFRVDGWDHLDLSKGLGSAA